MTEFEKQCYGVSEEYIRGNYLGSITAKLSGNEMVVMGILSDCQELLSQGYGDNLNMFTRSSVRQQLNIAKFILAEMMKEKETA